jgi:hypothetical protein
LLWTPLMSAGPTFYRDVLPVLQQRCQSCHHAGGSAPMSLETYAQARPWARAMAQAVTLKKMPPWFAAEGHFSNDPSLTAAQISVISEWVRSGAPEGDPKDAPARRRWPSGWAIGKPDEIVQMPQPFAIPKSGEIEYQYLILPSGFTQDQWVQRVEIQPGLRAAVHHAVVYIREPGSKWLAGSPKGVALNVPVETGFTTSDILFTYTPGNTSDEWPEGMAKLVRAGSDFVLQMHYTAVPGGGRDQTRIGMVFANAEPAQRVLTLQLNNDRFVIPPGVRDYRVGAWGTLPNDATLLSLFPHMHWRGSAFEYRITEPGEAPETLLRVDHYDFNWQLTYRLAKPLHLPAGTRIECTGIFDNSRANPHNPDPEAAVHYGLQSADEMMIGFFDVAVPAGVDKETFFKRPGH